ncbi:DNA glycosylase [Cokeromyces recurvatus]|uniref:DNA glycosylase n=1 Tax=Cokeromyces recurvatus TaxID=90255 RepID=UPI00221FC56B|nr:DNA glycosylase [Cokeromyces recurvatus]KAI7899653.1 DNA glycosylase [Cokeromyces recurvatus]
MNFEIEPSLIDIEECVQSNRLYHSDQYHKVSKKEKERIQHDLLEWYHAKKRTNMPWRKDVDKSWDREALGQRAYEVWVSEIMLQQTQVATVIDYYNRWMTAFPTIRDLAKADIENVNKLWSGLGYYSRAKRLWEGAQKVVSKFNGLLPDNAKDLQNEIPGVGRYTAGAISSIVFGEPSPVVDGNVIRVLSRWRAIHADPKKIKSVDLFWEIAASIVPELNPGDFNQALMELGARICTPQNPNCVECPIKNDCKAFNQLRVMKDLAKNGFFHEKTKKRKQMSISHECSVCHEIQEDISEEDYAVTRYPLKVSKKPPRDEECAVAIVEMINSKDDEPLYLISKRPSTGLLAGLWEFPSLELESLGINYEDRMKKTSQFLKTKYQIELENLSAIRHDLGNVVHLFSHIRKVYYIEWIQYQYNKDKDIINNKEDIKWVTLDELRSSPLPTGLKKAFKLLEKFKTSNTTHLSKKKKVISKTIKSADITSFFSVKKK